MFVFGLLQTTLPTSHYLSEKLTRNFVVKNALLIPGKMQFTLPGVFDILPYPSIVNGSLWTLPYEMSMYVVIAICGVVGILKSRVFSVIALSVPIILYGISIYESYTVRFAAFAAIGMLAFIFESTLLLSTRMVLVACVLFSVSVTFGLVELSQLIFCGYIILWLGYVPGGAIRRFNLMGDYSYGMYIYAYPIQQTLIQNITGLTPAALFASAFALTLPVAVLSWYFVESKVLHYAKRTKTPSHVD